MEYPNKITFSVTQSYIHKGVRMDCSKGPVALALYEQFPEAQLIRVIGLTHQIDTCKYVGDKELLRYIADYDQGFPMKPQTFTIDKALREEIY